MYHLFPVRSASRDAMQAHLRAAGIETLIHYPIPIPHQPALATEHPAECPIATRVCAEVFSLPLYPSLADAAVDEVAAALASGPRRAHADRSTSPNDEPGDDDSPRAVCSCSSPRRSSGSSKPACARGAARKRRRRFRDSSSTDPAIGYRLKPHARTRFTTSEFTAEIAINGAGLRDDEEIGPKAPQERRIVLLGDSLVLSVQVPFRQTFGELLEERLNSRSSPFRYRVINAGVQGYGPVEEQLFFRSIAGTVQPDLVLPVVFVGNDAEEAVGSRAQARRHPAARARSSPTRS